MVPDDKPKVKSMKAYNLIISILAVIGISFVFESYPIIVGISAFGIGLAYKSLSPEKETSDKKIGDVLD
jgi:hypothetical protein